MALRDVSKIEPAFCFNPCFNGHQSGGSESFLDYLYNKYVSILVLMDISLVAYDSIEEGLSFSSFNPCFNGHQSGGREKNSPRPREMKFQSLF